MLGLWCLDMMESATTVIFPSYSLTSPWHECMYVQWQNMSVFQTRWENLLHYWAHQTPIIFTTTTRCIAWKNHSYRHWYQYLFITNCTVVLIWQLICNKSNKMRTTRPNQNPKECNDSIQVLILAQGRKNQ